MYKTKGSDMKWLFKRLKQPVSTLKMFQWPPSWYCSRLVWNEWSHCIDPIWSNCTLTRSWRRSRAPCHSFLEGPIIDRTNTCGMLWPATHLGGTSTRMPSQFFIRTPVGVHCGPHARGPVPHRCPRPRAPKAHEAGVPAGHGFTSVGSTVDTYERYEVDPS